MVEPVVGAVVKEREGLNPMKRGDAAPGAA